MHVKTSLHARCVHARNRARNLSSPAGHYKQFSNVIGQEATEKDIPSNVSNARKVSELEQLSTVIVIRLDSKEKRTLFC